MRAYHPSRQRPFPTVPTVVGKLPINLLRTALYPGRQEQVGNAVEAWQTYMAGAPIPVMLPQRLAFQQWKTTPSGAHRYWAGSAQGLMALSEQYYRKSGVPTRVATRILAQPQAPYYPIAAAGMHYGGAYPGAGSARVGAAQPVLLRQLSRYPTHDVLAGQSHIAAPFPRPDHFIETLQANAARASYQKIQRRNAAEQNARYALVARRGVTGR